MLATCKIIIAGIVIEISSENVHLIGCLRQRYLAFAGDGSPALKIVIRWQSTSSGDRSEKPFFIDQDSSSFEQGNLRFSSAAYQGEVDLKQACGWLQLQTASPMDGVEYFFRVAYALYLFEMGGILLHGAGLVRDGFAHVFFGHSGSGKTTISRLSKDVVVLNDDLVALRPSDHGWDVYATPFWNSTQVAPTSHAAPLAGLYRLVQDCRIWLEKVSAAQAVAELAASVPVVSSDPQRSKFLMERCLQLATLVGVKRLHFREDNTFWDVICREQSASLEIHL